MSRLAANQARFASAIRSGDTDAFRAFALEITPAMIRHATGLLRDPAGAQDVVQATLIAIWDQRASLPDTTGQLRAYCFGVLANQARMLTRAEATRHGHEAAAGEARRADTSRAGVPSLAIEAWELAMQLPNAEREVVALRYGMGLTLEETAAALDLPVGTVSTRQRAGLTQLRDHLTTRMSALGVPALALAADSFRELETLLAAGEGVSPMATAGAAGSSVLHYLETTLMATTTGSKTGLTVAAILLLLFAMVGSVAWALFGHGDDRNANVPHANRPAQGDGGGSGSDAAGRSNAGGTNGSGDRSAMGTAGNANAADAASSGNQNSGGHATDNPDANAGNQTVDAGADETSEQPEPGTGLTGQIVNHLGEPMAGLAVTASKIVELVPGDVMAMMNERAESVRTVTDENGRFTIVGLDAAEAWRVGIAGTDHTLPQKQPAPALITGQVVDTGRITLPGTASIIGIVRDARGNPVADSIVRIGEPLPSGIEYMYADDGSVAGMQSYDPDSPRAAEEREDMEASANTPAHMRAARSSDDGTFVLPRVPAGSHVVSAHKRGHADAINYDVQVEVGTTTGPIELRLGEALSLEITIRDTEGRAIGGAKIAVASGPGADWRAEYTPQSRVQTGADGRVTIHDIENRDMCLWITADGFVSMPAAVRLNENGHTTREYVLQTGGGIRGVLVDPTGNPLATARIMLRLRGDGMYSGSVKTDETGVFRFAALRPGIYELEITHDDYASIPYGAHPVVDGETLDLGNVALLPYASLSVRVLDANDLPVEGATVKVNTGFDNDDVVNLEGREIERATSDVEGVATFERVTPGKVTVRASHGSAEAAGDLRAEPGEREVTIRLAEGRRIDGVALQADGSPWTAGRVCLFRDGWGRQLAATVRTDHQGRFAFENLAPGRWGLSTDDNGVSSFGSWVDVTAGQTTTATVTDFRLTLRISVRHSDGSPAAGMPIAIGHSRPGPNGAPGIQFPDSQGRSDNTGQATFTDVQVGMRNPSIEVVTRDGLRHVWPLPGNGPAVREIVLQLPPPDSAMVGGALEATIVDADGQPVNGAVVEIVADNLQANGPQFRRVIRTRPDGRLLLDNASPGTYRLTIRARGLATVRRVVKVGDAGATVGDIRLAHAGVVRVIAQSDDPHDIGRPVTFTVYSAELDNGYGEFTLDGSIGYPIVIDDMAFGGACVVTAEAPGFGAVTIIIRADADGAPRVLPLIAQD